MQPKAQLVDASYAREILMFQDRIRKAREILEGIPPHLRSPQEQTALDQLEGK